MDTGSGIISSDARAALGLGTLLACGAMLLLWLRQTRTKNATSVDVAWAANLGGLAVLYALLSDAPAERRILVAACGGLWGARLAWHLWRDRVGPVEDGRYATLRASWGAAAQPKFFMFFLAQGLLDGLLSVPFLLAAFDGRAGLGWNEYVGAAVVAVAVAGEALSDAQLARFKRRPGARGKTCREGLWACSRHPNYFFEWSAWTGFALLASGAPWGLVSWFAPALMLWLLFKVTGIPATEAQALRSRGDDYRDYQRTTSVFVPWFPKRTTTTRS